MAFDNRDSIDFGKNDIPQLFRSIFIPTLLGMIFNVAFIITDGIFVGHGIGPDGLAGVNLVAPIMMVINGLGMMFGVGCSVVAAIHLSQDNEKAARINVTQAFVTSTLVIMVMGLLLYLFPHTILGLLGVSEHLMPMTTTYYLWFIPTCLFLMLQIVGEFVIRLDGSPRYAMFANIIPAIINIIFDYLFIIPCGMGIKGAALATDIGTAVGAGMTFYYMFFKAERLKFYRLKMSTTSLRLMTRNIGYMVHLGLSAFIGELAISVMMLTGNIVFGRSLGDDGIAAYSVICYLFPVVYMIYGAVAQSSQPIISYNYGARQWERVRHTFRHSLYVSIAFGGVMTLAFALAAPVIIAVFLDSATAAFDLASHGLPLFAIGFVFVAFNMSAIGFYQSTEQAGYATLLMLLRGIIVLVPLFIILPRIMGTAGLWLAVPAAEAVTLLPAIINLKHNKTTEQ